MRVPYRAALGSARATLSYPGLEGFNIVPAVIEITIEPGSWLASVREYTPWCIGALVLAGAAWLAMRRKRSKAA